MTTKTDIKKSPACVAAEEYERRNPNRERSGTELYNAFMAGVSWQARAALQSQKPKGNDIMLSGVIRMPFEMAMADPISRMQFYQRAQQALNELEALQSQDRDKDRIDAERYRWLRADNAYFPEENHIWGGQELDEAIDHARRVEGD